MIGDVRVGTVPAIQNTATAEAGDLGELGKAVHHYL